MNTSHWQRLLLLSAILLLAWLAPRTRAQSTHTMDDAMLLMLAGQSRLHDDYDPAAQAALLGTAVPARGASRAQINEHKQLADYYQNFANNLPAGSPARQSFDNRAQAHQDQAQILEQARTRYFQQRRGMGGVLRRVGGAVARPVVQVARGLGRVGDKVFVIARDELISRVRQIVRDRVKDLVDLGEGRVDAIVARIARKGGWLLAGAAEEFVLRPALRRLERLVDQNVNRLLGERSDGEAANTEETSAEAEDAEVDDVNTPEDDSVADGDDVHTTDWDTVGEEGETGYDDEEEEEPTTVPADEEIVFAVQNWFTEASCRRFNGQLPSWMESTHASAYAWGNGQVLSCNWTTTGPETQYGCNEIGSNCARLPGRIEIEIHAWPTVARAQEEFRGHTTNCAQDSRCATGLTELVWAHSETEMAFGGEPAFFTRLIHINDNVVINIWWGGSQGEADAYGLLSTANAMIDPLQR